MHACLLAARCARFFLLFGMVMALAGPVQAQTGQIPSNPPPEAGQTAAPPEASPTAQAGQTAAPPEAAPTAQAVPAAADPATTAQTSLPAPSTEWVDTVLPMVKTVGGFGLVLSVILAGFILFRKFAPQYMGRRTQERYLRLLETLPVGEKRNVVLVQAGTRKLLLASTAGQITLLTSLADAAGPGSPNGVDVAESEYPAAALGDFKNLYEMEKRTSSVRPAVKPALPPDIRGKMRELRKALEG